MTFDDLLDLSNRDLAAVLAAGHAIDPAALDDTQYQGVSLGLPGWVVALTWKTFMKTFHRDPESGALRGWNVRLRQDGVDAPCTPRVKAGAPVTFGHYEVVDPPDAARPGLLIDYGRGRNAPWDPIRRVRDPLVAVREGDATVLLGGSYVDLGLEVGTPAYFALRLDGPLSHRA